MSTYKENIQHKIDILTLKGESKMSRLKIKPNANATRLPKPQWIRSNFGDVKNIQSIKNMLRKSGLNTVCEEANCPNLSECFSHGTATFMIMGDICTRRCPFCDVAHGKPLPLDSNEPQKVAQSIYDLKLKYVVITSVDRDDLRDGGAEHFTACICTIREKNPNTQVEILTPDFRGKKQKALTILGKHLPDVFNHNLETVPRLYSEARPGADYQYSLDLINEFKQLYPNIPTKSGIMLGLGETTEEIIDLLKDLRNHNCNWLTLGQYLQPSKFHLAVKRYVHPDEFSYLGKVAKDLGFSNVASAPMVRSSYHADLQAQGKLS